jgi:hypothetical protein
VLTTSDRNDDRLQRALREIHVRFARDSEGMVIAQMVHCSHEAVPHTTWEKVYPYWMVAEKDEEIIGCVQVCYSIPVGRMEFMSFLPNLPFRTRALAVKALLNLGALTLKKSGAQVVAGLLGFDQKVFKAHLKAEGCTVLASGNVMAKAVA